ncbi:Mor transcription activator family protein [Vibrio metoecus]|uniref:Mor transcription activator family protein n=1 Tax=Vibrio metoecus TaxID=1481663 RepID=UPI000BA9B4B2|nr:Mor transcription activator family protein [Vibrio metoecus]PAR29533.1 positive regulator of late transcription [Vibrio metoecus]PAR61493.1 positive regulator of late transcription [Vibrio metoecus]
MNKAANQEENFDMFGFDGVSLSDVEKLLGDEESKARWPEMMLTIFESLKDECSKLGLDEKVAMVLLARLCKDTGGLQYYFPKGEMLEHQLRCMYIWREFNGHNVPELSRKYGISTQKIYLAISKMRKLEVRKRQRQLF